MIGIRKRRSIVFELWIRLSAIVAVFTLLALGTYAWVGIGQQVDAAREQATTRAVAVATAATRLQESGIVPNPREAATARTLDVLGVQFIDTQGNITHIFGELGARGLRFDVEPELLEMVERDGLVTFDVVLNDRGFERADIDSLDVLRGGQYGVVDIMPSQGGAPGTVLIVSEYPNLSTNAWNLLLRSFLLIGGVVAVTVMGLWLLLDHLVARPLRQYSTTAGRIAAGEPLRMPDTSNNELGQLGQAINGMADILRHQASIDTLTGLYNLRHLTSRLESLLEEAHERNESLALLVCDLDNLKPVNDTFGHHAGDLLLKSVARQLLAWSGVEYTCWRTGGDEFAAVIPNVGPERAHSEARRLENAINSTTIGMPGGDISMSVSVGVALYPADGATGAALLNVADRRMYRSKAGKSKGTPATAA